MFPALHVGFATFQIWALATLTEVECILHEATTAISDPMARAPGTMPTCTHNSPFVSCVGTSEPEKHTCMATTLKHFNSDKTPWSTEKLGGLSIAPGVQAIVVDRDAIVNPQFASIVGVNAEAVWASFEDSHAACPTHSKVVTLTETGPVAICVAIVHHLAMSSLVGKELFAKTP